MDAAKQVKPNTDPKDETVRGALPLFKLRSKQDREQWRKLAFPEHGGSYIEKFLKLIG